MCTTEAGRAPRRKMITYSTYCAVLARRLAVGLTALLLTASALVGPANAQSYYFAPTANPGPATNASTTLERLTDQDITAASTANTKGAPSASFGTTSNAWSGLQIYFFGFNSAQRWMCDLSFDNGSTWAVQNLFFHPNTTSAGAGAAYTIPIRVNAGSAVRGRCQCSAGSLPAVRAMIVGEVASSSRAPGYTTFTALNVDTLNTKAGTQDVSMTNASWTPIMDPVAATYSAVLAAVDVGTTGPAAALWGRVILATGPSGGGLESEIGAFAIGLAQSSGVPRRHISPLLPVAIPSGSRVSAKAEPIAATDTATQVRIALYGLN